MQTLIKQALPVLAIVLLSIGCGKGKDRPKESKTTLIGKQPWLLRAYSVVRISDGFTQDAFAPMSACYKDDHYVFMTNNTYQGNAGATKCDPSDPQVFQTGTWRFINDEAKLERIITTGIGIGTIEFGVLSLSATELKIQTEDALQRHILTYSH
jgi:hypothetical protein